MLNEIMEIVFITIFCSFIVSKIRILKRMSFMKKIVINIVILAVMTLANPLMLAMYLGLFLVTEIFYYIFDTVPYKIKKADKVVISSIVSTLVTIFFIVLFKERIAEYINMGLAEMRATMTSMAAGSTEYTYIKDAERNIVQGMQMIKDHILINIFSTSILCTLGTYISLDKDSDEYWELSFEWLLLYIIPFFLIKLFHIDNHYLAEVAEIGLAIFSLYGAVIIYNLLNKLSGMKYISAALAIYMLLYSNMMVLVIGIAISFMPELLFKKEKLK